MDLDIVIIGAGVDGLAVASEVSNDGRAVYVIEKNRMFGMETSSRNSEVKHAGIHYTPGSLKARLCIEGRDLLDELVKNGYVHGKNIGKYIVATSQDQVGVLEERLKRGRENGVDEGRPDDEKLRIISGAELQKREPNVRAVAALWSPLTGIIDSHGLMEYFLKKAKSKGGDVVYETELIGIDKINGGYEITVKEGGGSIEKYTTRVLINAAGLKADEVAQMAGIDVDAAGYRQHYCKGEYFRVNGHRGKLNSLIYPVPEAHGLGVHATLELDRETGEIAGLKLGPNAFYIGRDADYSVDPSHQQEFFELAKPVLPFLEYDDLCPDQAGIRPKLKGPDDEGEPDFIVREESDKGFPGLITLAGNESPGLTAATAKGPHVAEIVDNILE
ncbi:NAD(P)/FAD-dependent oxidoreductase [Candidatus Woesearchaeota archaeon]|nr:NAD(P)/FAD-dependent oxidoreductase [Candidatus Woesearchaeota archaeon]